MQTLLMETYCENPHTGGIHNVPWKLYTCIFFQTMDQHNTELVYKITSEISMHCGKNPLVVSNPDYSEVSM